jgi:hypothetical protein
MSQFMLPSVIAPGEILQGAAFPQQESLDSVLGQDHQILEAKSLVPAFALLPGLLDFPEEGALVRLAVHSSSVSSTFARNNSHRMSDGGPP